MKLVLSIENGVDVWSMGRFTVIKKMAIKIPLITCCLCGD